MKVWVLEYHLDYEGMLIYEVFAKKPDYQALVDADFDYRPSEADLKNLHECGFARAKGCEWRLVERDLK